MKNRLLIFTPCWEINQIKYILPKLMDDYDCLSLNNFSSNLNKEFLNLYGKVKSYCKYWLCVDNPFPWHKCRAGEKLIASPEVDEELRMDKSQFPVYQKVTDEYLHGIVPDIVFGYTRQFDPYAKDKYCKYGSCITTAIDFGYKQGYEEIILFAKLDNYWEYFYEPPRDYVNRFQIEKGRFEHKRNRKQPILNEINRFIAEFQEKTDCKLYNVFDSDINCEKINIKDL